jgi:AcrR family transcriptional regulator
MSRRRGAYHHGDLREALVAAGIGILKQKGRGALTLRACARAAGVSHAAPQHHFASLDDLLAEIAARGFEQFVAALEVSSRGKRTARQRLVAMCKAYIAFAHENAPIYELMFRQGSSQLKSVHLKQAAIAAWHQLETAVSCVLGEARVAQTRTKAAFVWSSVHGVATLLIDRRLPPDIVEARLVDEAALGIAAAVES